MAIGIQNYPNIDTSDPTDFPNGQIKDRAIGVPGTRVNRLTNGDIHFTFDKIIRESGSVANGSPDAEGGSQYYDAMSGLFGKASFDVRTTLAGDSIAFEFSRNILYTNSLSATNSINLIASAIPDVPGNRCHIIVPCHTGDIITIGTTGTVFLATGGPSLTATNNSFMILNIEYFGTHSGVAKYVIWAYTT